VYLSRKEREETERKGGASNEEETEKMSMFPEMAPSNAEDWTNEDVCNIENNRNNRLYLTRKGVGGTIMLKSKSRGEARLSSCLAEIQNRSKQIERLHQ
jgi:t-SNARE complex subunit (syntaxin)